MVRSFESRLVEKWKNSNRTLSNFEERNKDWLDNEILLFEQPTTSHNAGRPPKEFAKCFPKTQINEVSQFVNETPCEKLVVATSVSIHKAGKRRASEVVHSDKEVAAKIK